MLTGLGTTTAAPPIQQIAAIFPRRLTYDFWDKTAVKSIEKLSRTRSGYQPQNDGASIRLSFPS
ncbi:MAG: hypothetical protein ACLTYN_11065 [Dysosmobacter welbionis]